MTLKDGDLLVQEAEEQWEHTKAWLAGDSRYQTDFVERLWASDPRLRNRDPKATTHKIPWSDRGRVVRLEANDGSIFGAATEFPDPSSLEECLAKSAPQPGRKAVYILEGVGPGFVSVLGGHFGLHPSVFVDHERVIVMNQKAQGESDGVPLPSMIQGRDHVTLKYFEPLQLSRQPASFRLACGTTGRHIGVSRADGTFTDVVVARRKCTMWTRRTEGGGWECLLICDPAVTRVRTGEDYRDCYAVTTQPYQGGYVDFVPTAAQVRRRGLGKPGPPRSSFLDDVVFYLQEHAGSVLSATGAGDDLWADPDTVVGTFARKIVASHYFKLAEHLRATLSAAQRALSRKHDLASLPMEKVEELWSDIQAWERRVGEYCEDLEAIMLQLGVAFEDPNTGAASPGDRPRWLDPGLDFQFLRLRFRELRGRTENLNSAVTGLASITGNRQQYKEQQLALETARRSIREAKSSKAVTLLGLIFIPLAYTSAVFGMEPPYGPGGDQFWQYLAASAPLIVIVLAGYYILDFGYTDDGASWSLDVFLGTVRAKMKKQPPAGAGARGQGEHSEVGASI